MGLRGRPRRALRTFGPRRKRMRLSAVENQAATVEFAVDARVHRYCFIPVSAMPWMNCRWNRKNTTINGTMAIRAPAICQCT